MPEAPKPTPPAKSPHEIEQERKLALIRRVRLTRERGLLARGEVKGDPSKSYVWVNEDPHQQSTYQALGYKKVVDDPKAPKVKSMWGPRSDGTHKRADVILYEIDKELHEAINMESQLQAIEALEGSRNLFRSFADQKGIPTREVPVA